MRVEPVGLELIPLSPERWQHMPPVDPALTYKGRARGSIKTLELGLVAPVTTAIFELPTRSQPVTTASS